MFEVIYIYIQNYLILLLTINHAIDILILIRNYNMYDVWTHVIQSIIKLHAVMFRIKKIQGKFKYKYSNNNSSP